VIVESWCDLTTVMVLPWAEAGYVCYCIDLQHPPGETIDENGIVRVGADARIWVPPYSPDDVSIRFAFPPCTHLANSGNRWKQGKGLPAFIEALQLVDAMRQRCETSDAPYALENPVGPLSTYWRKPDFTFDPCDFGGYLNPPGDAYTKRTCLWTGNGFKFPVKRRVEPIEGSKMHKLPPSANRANLRAATPAGFAQAVFEANHEFIRREAA
jgi:hypothetical protein